ncbi:hypothetical protein SLS63_012593 [Diaporthe eres]|uniref:BTB domain-containing protein n=1 Tax=Diaporthe eres TaxID=83184 RepID=A0ABR1NQW4_DIAER
MSASSPPSAASPVDGIAKIGSIWGDKRYSDASIIMGQKVWPVHRWVICQQSPYFEKALEGEFMESKNKTVNLTGSPFVEEQVDGMLKYLYFNELDNRQKKDPIGAFMVADYFQVASLLTKAADQLSKGLKDLASKKFFVGFKDYCNIVLGQHPGTHLEETVIKVVADNLSMVMHESGAWGELTDAYPKLAKKVLAVICPKPAALTGIKRPAGLAFDDTLQSGRPSKGLALRSGSIYYG